MAQWAKSGRNPLLPGSTVFGEAAAGAGRRFSWIWSRESLLRLGLSLLLAVALWLYVTSKTNPSFVDFSQPIPVAVQNFNNGQLTVTNTLQRVHVRYHVDNPNTYVSPANFHAYVNLFGLKPGPWPHVKVQMISDPGISVVKITPAYIPVNIETLQVKRVPVRANLLTGTLPSGYQIGVPSIQPNEVTVTGPASLVSQITQAAVDVNLSGAQTSVLSTQSPLAEDSQGTPVSGTSLHLKPAQVQVTLPIKAIKSFKTVPLLVPSLQGQPKAGFSVVGVSVSPSELTAHGSPQLLDRLSRASTLPVSIAGLSQGTYVTRVKVHLPKGVSSKTAFAKVSIELKPVEASSSIQVGIMAQNVGPNLTAHVAPAFVLVTVVGPSTGLRRVGRELTATVDTTGYGIGTFQFRPVVTAPAGFTVEGVYPLSVAVTIQSVR